MSRSTWSATRRLSAKHRNNTKREPSGSCVLSPGSPRRLQEAGMQSYEVVREVENQCANNQMRDIFFEEIETDDPGRLAARVCQGTGRRDERGQKGKRRSDRLCHKRRRDAEIPVYKNLKNSSGILQKSQIIFDISLVCFLHIFMQFLQKWACLCRNFVLRYFCIESAEGRAPRTRRNFIILEASYERCGNL